MTARHAAIAGLLFLAPGPLAAAVEPSGAPTLTLSLGGSDPKALPAVLQIVLLMTVLTLAPAFVIMLTSFTRILIVLSFTRSALGTQQIPPNTVLAGLALFLTIFTMAPVWQTINDQALQPYLAGEIDYERAGELALSPLRAFMLRQTPEPDLALFVHLSKLPRPATSAEVPTYVLVPAFMTGELKTAFAMGFMIFIPFVVIDMVVATMLMSMGMMMMPPVVISLPCKLLLFILVNGWDVIAQSLVTSFH